MSNKQIKNFSEKTSIDSNDYFLIQNVSNSVTSKIAFGTISNSFIPSVTNTIITAGTYVPTLTNRTIICDCSSGNIIINFPGITEEWGGVEFNIKARYVGSNTITVNCDANDDIDGSPSLPVINIQYTSYTLIASYDAGGNSFWSII